MTSRIHAGIEVGLLAIAGHRLRQTACACYFGTAARREVLPDLFQGATAEEAGAVPTLNERFWANTDEKRGSILQRKLRLHRLP